MNPPSIGSESCYSYKDAIFFSGHKFIGGPGNFLSYRLPFCPLSFFFPSFFVFHFTLSPSYSYFTIPLHLPLHLYLYSYLPPHLLYLPLPPSHPPNPSSLRHTRRPRLQEKHPPQRGPSSLFARRWYRTVRVSCKHHVRYYRVEMLE